MTDEQNTEPQSPDPQFREDEDGAVSVDWVVLTAAIVGLAVGSAGTIRDAMVSLSGSIGNGLTTAEVDNGN